MDHNKLLAQTTYMIILLVRMDLTVTVGLILVVYVVFTIFFTGKLVCLHPSALHQQLKCWYKTIACKKTM